MKHHKAFGIYHWDTFDNETILIKEADLLEEAEEYVKQHYGNRLSANGADRVEIVDKKGKVVSSQSVR